MGESGQARGVLRRRVVAVLAVLVLAAGCSGGDDGGDDLPEGVEESFDEPVLRLEDNPCSLTSASEVQDLFEAPIRAGFDDGTCTYEAGGLGRISYRLYRGEARPLDAIAPGGEVVSDVGDGAVWVARDGQRGGVLFARAGSDVIEIDAELAMNSGAARDRAGRLASAIAERIAERSGNGDEGESGDDEGGGGEGEGGGGEGESGEASADGGETDPCDRVAETVQLFVLGDEPEATQEGDATCRYRSADGAVAVTVTIGGPASVGVLDDFRRVITIEGEASEWPRDEVDGVGDRAVQLSDPLDPRSVELWAVRGSRLVQVTARAGDGNGATSVARAFATSALDR